MAKVKVTLQHIMKVGKRAQSTP